MLQKSPTLDPSLRNLAYILRHREWWPEWFEWDFRQCATCAIGLSRQLWEVYPSELDDGVLPQLSSEYDEIFCESDSKRTFWERFFFRKLSFKDVTPEMVADQIDAFLARQVR